MKFVIIKLVGGKYLFSVQRGVTVLAGEKVVVDTSRGEATGVALCDSFYVSDEETQKMLMDAWGTQKERMKPVVGFMEIRYFGKEEDCSHDKTDSI